MSQDAQSLGRCARCGEKLSAGTPHAAGHTRYCPGCDAALERLGAAQTALAAPRFRGAVPLVVGVVGAANPFQLVGIEAWDRWFDVRYFEVVPPNRPPPDDVGGEGPCWVASSIALPTCAQSRWFALTDVGTEHDGFFQGGGGDGRRWRGEIAFHPPLPEQATSITFTFGPRDADLSVGPIDLSGWPGRIHRPALTVAEEIPLVIDAGCRRCGAPSIERNGFCGACRETVDQTVAAYSASDLGPYRVTPLNAELGVIAGATSTLLSLEESEGWFNLRYHIFPWEPTRGAVDPPLHRRYEAHDEHGRIYRGFGNSSTGSDGGWTGEISFSPGLHPDATHLTLSLKAPDETNLVSVALPLTRI